MEYCGDNLEDVVANEKLSARLSDPSEQLSLAEELIASDYYKWGWEDAMAFVKESKQ